MKKISLFVFMFMCMFVRLVAQEYTGREAHALITGAEKLILKDYSEIPAFVVFGNQGSFSHREFENWVNTYYRMDPAYGLQLVREESDYLGFTHYRYQQTFHGYPVFANVYLLHEKNGLVSSMNGRLFNRARPVNVMPMTEEAALASALGYVNALVYKWDLPEEERALQYAMGKTDATYYPKGELMWVPSDVQMNGSDLKLAWRFDIYAHEPMSRQYIFVDAANGNILNTIDRIHTETGDVQVNATGTAVTRYSGTRTITTDYTGSTYRLRETGRGLGVETYDMNKGTNYGAAVDFTDANNNWNNVNADQDEVATDAHWASEMTYDYYNLRHGRNSIDDAGLKLLSYVHYDNNYVNAFWDGTRMTYGDGDGTYSPLTTVDICAHEITHGVTEYTANLTYSYESGALNEAFSDIFGTSVEFYAKPPLTPNWLIGEDIGGAFRSMSNPNAGSQPDTYQGTYWYTGTADNGGVHTNSGVGNFWYYLLCQGGSGTNDIGNSYSVTGITMAKAEQIAYRMLTVYLTASSNHADARAAAIQASSDLFGGCSQETISTTNAWYAVGVGAAYSATPTNADFTACPTTQCTNAPFTVQFQNLSTSGNTYTWYFGDGTTSTAVNPSHTYTANGSYDVKLVANGASCGIDSLTKAAFITVGPSYPCVAFVPATGTGTVQTSCTGNLYDSGICSDYGDNTNGNITISPAGATSVTLTFSSFNYESGYDYLYVYDGPSTASPQVTGSPFSGTSLPGPITSSGGSITLRQTSDGYVVGSGFALTWTCVSSTQPPLANFSANTTTSCSGTINFTDLSTNGPTSWLWNFGDGQTSTLQNPSHTYAANGNFTVTLQATNAYGNDTEIKTNYVTINMPVAPVTTGASRCGSGTLTLTAAGSGTLRWFDAPTGGTQVSTGTSYTTPVLTSTTNYYVQDSINGASYNCGRANNSGSGGYTATGDRYEVFHCYTPVTLVSVDIYGNPSIAPGIRTIELRNSAGTVLQSVTTPALTSGLNTVTLNFNIPADTGLRLAITSVANIFRNNGDLTYPYTTPGILSVVRSDVGTGYYYAFYNWVVREPGCNSARSVVTATINPNPVAPVSVSASPASVCSGNATILTASGGSGTTLRWLTGGCGGTSIGTGNNLSVSPSANTTYYARWENSCGNSTCQSVSVSITPSPAGGTAQAASPSLCTGNSTTVNLSGYTGTIQWQSNAGGTWANIGGATSPSYNTPVLTASTSYRAILTSGSCGSDTSDVATVTIIPGALAGTASTSQNAVCSGSTTTLNLSGSSGNIQWQSNDGGGWQDITGANSTSWTTSPITQTMTYRAVLTAGGCPSDTSNTVSVSLLTASTAPTAISGDLGICQGDATILTASGGTTGSGAYYEWGTGNSCGSNIIGGQNSVTINLSGLTDTTVIWVRRNGGDCNVATSCTYVTVLVAPAPVASISPQGSTDLCTGDYLVLEAPQGSGYTYEWYYNGSPIAGALQYLYTVFQSGSYTVEVTNACGSLTSSPLQVNVWPAPSTPFISIANDTLLSSAPAGNQWYLNGTLIPGATENWYVPQSSGDYTVIVTEPHGCGTATSPVFQYVITGLQGDEAISISIWPNPTDGMLNISLNGNNQEELLLNLTDLSGRYISGLRIPASAPGNRYELDLTLLSTGVYILSIESEQINLIRKVIRK